MRIITILSKRKPIEQEETEIVERKGIGHPDSLADGIAEAISREYSNYCLRNFGVILHHRTDKCTITGNGAEVHFGFGRLLKPITVVLCGRLSDKFGSENIPIHEIAEIATRKYLKSVLPLLNCEEELEIVSMLGTSPGPGRSKYWFKPRSKEDLPEIKVPRANDTVSAVCYAPLSETEKLTIRIEQFLNSKDFKAKEPEIGTDIKVMSCRVKDHLMVTICIPFIANFTPTPIFYRQKIKELACIIQDLVNECERNFKCTIRINTPRRYYLTAIGTSAEAGDQGQTGRGNRITGTISNVREMSLEGICGKNPVYHVGKLYNVLALKIANNIFEHLGLENYVNIVSQNGRRLDDPLLVAVKLIGTDYLDKTTKRTVEDIIWQQFGSIPKITQQIVDGSIQLF